MILHTYPYFSSYSVSANRQCPNTSNRHGLACYFMLKDISKLSVAGKRLEDACKGIQRSHGKESTRLRLLHGNSHPELVL